MSFIVAQLGARRHYAIPRMLHQAGLLEHFYTDICAVKGWPRALRVVPDRWRPAGLKRLLGRVPLGIPLERITAFNRFGWEYQRRLAKARSKSETIKIFLWASREFNRLVIEKKELGEVTGTYTFNGAGLELLSHARERGLCAVMEQTSAPREIEAQLYYEEYEHHPGWVDSPPDASVAKEISIRIRAEWDLASVILCASEFTRNGIAACGGPVERCVIVPYGIDARYKVSERLPRGGLLRVLTVGRVSLSKGAPYVLDAAQRLRGRAVFRMVGSINVPPHAEARLRELVELTGTIPRSEIVRQFAWADILLFPTVCDGFGLVILEALSAGLPVIATSHSGAPDVVRNGVDGYIVEPRNVDAIVEHIDRLAGDRELLQQMSTAALTRTDISMQAYQYRLLAAILGKDYEGLPV